MFNCPANLASHRRWHKPRSNGSQKTNMHPPVNKPPKSVDADDDNIKPPHSADVGYTCKDCGKVFRRLVLLYLAFKNRF